MTMESWWRCVNSLLMKYKFMYVLLLFASVMQGRSWIEWTVFLWNIFCKNNFSGKKQLLRTMKAMFQKSFNSLCTETRNIFGIRGTLSTWLRHGGTFQWGLFLGSDSACQGRLYVHRWTFDITYPFLIKVLNPLLFPTCNVLYQFQSNTQLATRNGAWVSGFTSL